MSTSRPTPANPSPGTRPTVPSTSLRLPPGTMERLRALADELDRSVDELFSDTVDRGLAALESGATHIGDVIGGPVVTELSVLNEPVSGGPQAKDDEYVIVLPDRRLRCLSKPHVRRVHLRSDGGPMSSSKRA